MKLQTVYWDITLFVECPKCKETFDILEDSENVAGIEIAECVEGLEISCPECTCDFLVNLEY